MPIYEYRCQSCEHEFELFQQRGDDDPDVCPACEHDGVKRLISNTSFQLKGSGWYETDYARDDEPTSEAQDENEGTEAAEGAETTAETDTSSEVAEPTDEPEAA